MFKLQKTCATKERYLWIYPYIAGGAGGEREESVKSLSVWIEVLVLSEELVVINKAGKTFGGGIFQGIGLDNVRGFCIQN